MSSQWNSFFGPPIIKFLTFQVYFIKSTPLKYQKTVLYLDYGLLHWWRPCIGFKMKSPYPVTVSFIHATTCTLSKTFFNHQNSLYHSCYLYWLWSAPRHDPLILRNEERFLKNNNNFKKDIPTAGKIQFFSHKILLQIVPFLSTPFFKQGLFAFQNKQTISWVIQYISSFKYKSYEKLAIYLNF